MECVIGTSAQVAVVQLDLAKVCDCASCQFLFCAVQHGWLIVSVMPMNLLDDSQQSSFVSSLRRGCPLLPLLFCLVLKLLRRLKLQDSNVHQFLDEKTRKKKVPFFFVTDARSGHNPAHQEGKCCSTLMRSIVEGGCNLSPHEEE